MTTTVSLGLLLNRTLAGAGSGHLRWGESAYGDLDRDGFDDLVMGGGYFPNEPYAGLVARPGFVLFGSQAGFEPASNEEFDEAHMLDVHPREYLFADFNEDGANDLFIADHGYDAPPFPGQQNVLILSSAGPTGFSWGAATSNLPQQSDFTHSATVGDVNRDGHLDIFAGNNRLEDSYFLLGDGHGGFSKDVQLLPGYPALAPGIALTACLLADLDLDGWDDLVIGGSGLTADRQVFWSNSGSYAQSGGSPLPVPDFGDNWWVMDVQSTDVNFDGLPDLIVNYIGAVQDGGWLLQVLVNQGDRTFTDESETYIPQAGARSGGVPTGTGYSPWIGFLVPRDLNGDGRTDFSLDVRPWNGVPPPLDCPMLLIHQPDGTFDPFTVGEARALGMPDFMAFGAGVRYVARGPDGAGEFNVVYAWDDATTVGMTAMPVSFSQAATQWIAGSAAADVLAGTAGNDDMGGFGGNDTLDGGAGIDLARYNATSAQLELSKHGAGWVVGSALDGTDSIAGIERLKLADTSLALDLDGHAGSVAKVLGALFGPESVSNRDYVGIGLDLLDNGMSYEQLVALVVDAGIVALLAGSNTNAAFVSFVYENVVGWSPSAQDLAYLTGLLDSGAFTQSLLALLACESDLNQASIGLVGLAATGLEYTPVA
ncbi:MAG TPA: FG-GAP-like repeat-containing protein [Ramlibacter sp.]|nr:FG-GAP-like repeat-containing protein [Ramlibacter sp.]